MGGGGAIAYSPFIFGAAGEKKKWEGGAKIWGSSEILPTPGVDFHGGIQKPLPVIWGGGCQLCKGNTTHIFTFIKQDH